MRSDKELVSHMSSKNSILSMPTASSPVFLWILVLTVAFISYSTASVAQTAEGRSTAYLSLALYKSDIVNLEKTPTRVSVGNPAIADIIILRGNQIHVLGKALGSTNIMFWDKDDQIFATLDVEVTHDLNSLKRKLHRMMPDENISVHSAQENLIMEGHVTSASKLKAALEIARGYLPECISSESVNNDIDGKEARSNADSCDNAGIVNLLSVAGSQQIMLEVKVAEISRAVQKSMDADVSFLNFGGNVQGGAINGGGIAIPSGGDSVAGAIANQFVPNAASIANTGLFLSELSGANFFSAALELSRSKGLAKVLAEPNLTTLTGKPARFLAGGEFPVPIPGADGSAIEFKEFGVSVDFLPTLLDSNAISLDLDIEVSEISSQNSVDLGVSGSQSVFAIPSLTKRGASSTVELVNGQTIGIAGLIQDNVSEIITKLPGLGDVPVLGALFRSQQFQSNQTELVIFVTAHLAKPIAPDMVRLPTDSFVPPSDVEFYLLGQMESLKDNSQQESAPESETVRRTQPLDGGFDGVTFGHEL